MSKVDVKMVLSHAPAPYEVTPSNDESILYALGIGFQNDPMNEKHYRYTYENADEFGTFPTMAVVVGHRGAMA